MSRPFFNCLLAYVIWGVLPVYWKLLDGVSSIYILLCRIVFSCVFAVILVSFQKKWTEIRRIVKTPKKLFLAIGCGLTIAMNWGLFIYTVNAGHVLDSSLAYYINPLLFVLFGVVFFRERMNVPEIIALILAGAGVIVSTVAYGSFPLMPILMAATFGFYGVLKKKLNEPSTISFAVETMAMAPFALVGMLFMDGAGTGGFATGSWAEILLLIAGGVVTATPLLLYADGVRHLPLATVGFLQFISPTGMLFLGVLAYGEPFTTAQAVTFALIWAGIAVYLYSSLHHRKKKSLPKEDQPSV